MLRHRKDGEETRERLLESAYGVFAAKGFRGATVAEICRGAGANIASVNYHFGSKAALYVAAWRHSLVRSLEAHPPDGGVPASASAADRLRGRIRAIMARVSDPESHGLDIVMKEMANPTGLLAEVMRECLEPIRQGLLGVIRELLGPAASEERVRLCHMSIMAQCFGPLLHERRRRREGKGLHPPSPDWVALDVPTLADHVADFSLAGIRAVRRAASGKRAGRKKGTQRRRTRAARESRE